MNGGILVLIQCRGAQYPTSLLTRNNPSAILSKIFKERVHGETEYERTNRRSRWPWVCRPSYCRGIWQTPSHDRLRYQQGQGRRTSESFRSDRGSIRG